MSVELILIMGFCAIAGGFVAMAKLINERFTKTIHHIEEIERVTKEIYAIKHDEDNTRKLKGEW